MVEVGDFILINNEVEALIIVLFPVEDGRWFIGYKVKNGTEIGCFLEGDQQFEVIDRQVDRMGHI